MDAAAIVRLVDKVDIVDIVDEVDASGRGWDGEKMVI